MRDLLKSYGFPGDNLPVVRVSALKALQGEASGVDSILKLMEALDAYRPMPQRDIEKPFMMQSKTCYSIFGGSAPIVTGRVERGKVKVGEEIEIVGYEATEKKVVTGVEMFRKLLDEGVAGDDIGVLLRGVEKGKLVERGQVLAKPGTIKPHTKFIAEVPSSVEGRGWPPHRVLQRLSPAVLYPHHRRDRLAPSAGGRRDGDAGDEHDPFPPS